MGSQTGVIGGGNLGEQLGTSTTLARLNVIEKKTASFNVAGINRTGYNAAIFYLASGAADTGGTFSAKVQHAPLTAAGAVPADGDGSWADLAAADVAWGSVATAAGALSGDNAVVLKVDLRNADAAIRLAFTKDAGTGLVLATSAVLGAADTLPA